MGRLAGFKYRVVVKKLKQLGWEFNRTGRGSHEIWIHRDTERTVTVTNHPGDMPEGTLHAILRAGKIDVPKFLNA